MSKTIDLPNEVYEWLERQARARDLTVSQVVAQLIEEVEAARLSAALEKMRAKGLLAEKKPSLAEASEKFKPIRVQGKPLSEVIIEERR